MVGSRVAMAGREAAMVAAAADMTDSEVALRARAVGLRAEVARAGGMRAEVVRTAMAKTETAGGVEVTVVAQRAAAVRAAAEGAAAEAAMRVAEGETRGGEMATARKEAAVGKYKAATLVAEGQC